MKNNQEEKKENKKEEKKEESKNPITHLEKPVWQMSDNELHDLLDVHWYPKADNALEKQRKIWDYSYIAYKGIMLYNEVNRKRRNNGYGMYVNVPRTFATIEGIRKNFNINKLKIDIVKPNGDIKNINEGASRYKIRRFLNYDLDRSGTREQIKSAGFDKLLYGNGFLYSFLMDKQGKYGNISGGVDEDTGRVKASMDKEKVKKYYGMVARRISPYKVFPDPDGVHLDTENKVDRLCNYVCIRSCKHIANFRNDWRGVIPDKILDSIEPGGKDMTNHEAVRDTFDLLFDYDNHRYPGTTEDFVQENAPSSTFSSDEYVEERVWLGEDFLIVQAGKGLKICLVSPNPNPEKKYALTKMDDVSIPGEFWSMGEPYLIRYQQIEENRVHNSILDNLHFSVSGMMGLNSQYLEDPYDTEVYPGKVWKFKAIPGVSINDVMQNFQPSPAGIAPALKFMQEVKQTGQQATSITDFVMGASKSIADTATEANRLSSASDLTIVDKIREMVSGAMIDVCKNWLAQYPIVYDGEKIEDAQAEESLYFVGKNKESISKKELKKILDKDYEPEDILFLDDLDVSNPKIQVIGDVEVSKELKFRQYTEAINFGNSVNKMAFETGDSRRIDTIKMATDALGNFEMIGNPDDYIILEQPTKSDLVKETAMAGAQANNTQQRAGGRPESQEVDVPKSDDSEMRSRAQE